MGWGMGRILRVLLGGRWSGEVEEGREGGMEEVEEAGGGVMDPVVDGVGVGNGE